MAVDDYVRDYEKQQVFFTCIKIIIINFLSVVCRSCNILDPNILQKYCFSSMLKIFLPITRVVEFSLLAL